MNTKKLILISFCMLFVTSTALADWEPQDGHKMHYPQLPDPCGFDVSWMNVWALGDDWECSATGPVEDIHFWVSFQYGEGTPDDIQNFNIEIWSNNPGDPNIPFSHPEELLWTYIQPPFTWRYVDTDWQGWFDPWMFDWWTYDHVGCYQINVENIPDPFIQQEGEIYWLVISDVNAPGTPVGWKESNDHFMDDAVWVYDMPWWEELLDPEFYESMDLAFVITGGEEPGIKWEQLPDPCATGFHAHDGLHIADDWLCEGGLVTDLHWWGNNEDNMYDNWGFDISIYADAGGLPDVNSGPLWSVSAPLGSGPGEVRRTYSGLDTQWFGPVWYYEYYLQDPFPQVDGEIYWLDLSAISEDPMMSPMWHWQGNYDPIILSDSVQWEPPDYMYQLGLNMAFRITSEEPEPGIKWEQLPDLADTGIDVDISYCGPAGDDFECTTNGPITDIHIWGSWRYDELPFWWEIPGGDPTAVSFLISIYSNDPCGPMGYSQPDEWLYDWWFEPGDFNVSIYAEDLNEGYYRPCQEYYQWPGDWTCWRYDFYIDPCDVFIQQGSPNEPITYWLVVQAYPEDDITYFGWKTSLDHWEDDAVWGGEIPVGLSSNPKPLQFEWYELRYPFEHPYEGQSMDLAFVITTEEEPEPGIKWEQLPCLDDPNICMDVDATDDDWMSYAPQVLADDFNCTTTGLITDIHIWSSWLDDYPPYGEPNNVWFTLCIYSNDPCGPMGWSQPDELLWTKEFHQGDFDVEIYAEGPEAYYIPCEPLYLPDSDWTCWLYSFYIDPYEAFVQEGDPCNPVIYWLALQAHIYDPLPMFHWRFGWKNSSEQWNDDAVWAVGWLPGDLLTDWQELRHPMTDESVDLAFTITTEPVEAKPAIPHLKWSQPPIEIDPNADTPTYCGWDEPSYKEQLPYGCEFECWGPNWPRQCHGDADNKKVFLYWVNVADLNMLIDAFGGVYPNPPYNPCTDFDRDYVVGIKDVNIMRQWFNKRDVPADCPPCAGEPAPGEEQYFDLFAVSLSPNDVYWNLVEGGYGTWTDPLISPDPAPVPVTDSNTPLDGVAWGFGGLDWGDRVLESDVNNAYSIELKGEPNYYLSVVLDTDTLPQHDDTMSSWGTISDIVVRPWDEGTETWLDPIEVNENDWVISPLDPDGGTTVVSSETSSTVTLAGNNFGDPEINLIGQPMGIWGAAAELPPADGYKVDFNTAVFTWDSYDANGPVPPVPVTVSWQVAADDFRCLGTMPVISVHWWGSYLGWEGPDPPPMMEPEIWLIGFWSNVPAGFETWYSHPGELLWQVEVRAPRVEIEYVGEDNFPDMPAESCFQYHAEFLQEERFWQHEFLDQTSDDIFWLSIAAIYDPCLFDIEHPWGWKTRPWRWMDDAVRFHLDEDPYVGMELEPSANTIEPIEDPYYGESFDLAFELDTDPNFIKWEQAYDSIRHWPHYEDEESMAIGDVCEPSNIIRLVADDWPCDTNGAVSAIVWWGSYIDYTYEACQGPPINLPVQPDYFWLGIWTDTPAGPNSFSHPDDLIWEYKAYDYDEVLVGYDKYPEYEPPFRTEPVFRYSVRIPDEEQFCQEQADGIYWLSVVAVYDQNMPNYGWGWTNHKHVSPPPDDAVAGYLDFYSEWTWEELYNQTGKSTDMSFMLFTECLSCSSPEYADWIAWGKPRCWCYPRQCRGDIDGLKIGFWCVNAADLALFRAAFFQQDPQLALIPNGICSDLDHIKVGFWRVNAADLAIFRTYFFQMDPLVPLCDQPPIYTGPYNFWTSP